VNVRPNPGRDEQAIAFELAAGDHAAAVENFSVAGQRVWRRSLTSFGVGAHTLSWNGTDDHGRRCGPGVYWAHIVTQRGTTAQRFVRVH